MTIDGRLLSITAIVKRFQIEKNLGPSEWQAPLPIRISQPYMVLENHSDGDTRPRKKFDDYLYLFWYNTSVWQTRDDSNSRAHA